VLGGFCSLLSFFLAANKNKPRYAALFAGSPEPPKDQSQDDDDGDDDDGVEMSGHEFAKRLLGMLKKENLDNILQLLISDVQIRLDDLAKDPKGMTDPFESIYGIVYQLTIRTVACNEIADNRALLDQTLDLYQQLEAASSPEVIIFPWLPSPSKLKRLWGGGKLYMIFKNIIEKRQKTGHRENDALQYLIDKGDNIKAILVFVIGALFAGLLNSGINAGWVLIYLAKDPHWRSQVWKEVKSVAEKYDKDATKSWPERLRSVPVEAWEAEFPTIDMCLRDSIRLHAPGSMFRRNTSNKAVKLTDDTEIPPGAYAAYAIGEVHLDPQTYPNPLQWDPSRYLPDKAEDQKKKLAYLGWGAGRHPCLGMRFAKLEQNIILAFFLAYFDFELVDKDGNSGVQLPKPAINDYSATKPKERVFVKYEPRV
jgi:cytochrome P450